MKFFNFFRPLKICHEVIIVFIRLVRPVQEKNNIFVQLLKVLTNLRYKALKILDNGPNSCLNSTTNKIICADRNLLEHAAVVNQKMISLLTPNRDLG